MIDRETLGDHQAGLPLVWRGAVGDDDEGGRTREAGLGENGHTASRVTPVYAWRRRHGRRKLRSFGGVMR